MTNGEDLAFPFKEHEMIPPSYGLTKREWMATMILSGMSASTPGCVGESCVLFAVKEADALIRELNKKENEG